MKKGLLYVVSLLCLISCTNSDKTNGELLIISLDASIKDDMSFLESIEVVPLETLDTALVKTPQSFQPIKAEKGKFLLFDTNQIIFLFDTLYFEIYQLKYICICKAV